MFDPQHQRIDESYLQVVRNTSEAALALAKILIDTFKQIREVLKEAEEADKIAVEIGKDTFNLVPDESTEGAYKWEKVDLSNPLEPKIIAKGEGIELTDFQAQTIASRIVQDVADLADNSSIDYQPAIRVTAYTESGDKTVIYEQDSEGKCRTNLVTETLSQDEIMDVAYEPIVKLLPASSDIVKNYEVRKYFIESDNGNSNSQTATTDDEPFFIEDNQVTQETTPETPTTVETVDNTPIAERTEIFYSDVDISNPPEFDYPPDEVEIVNNESKEPQAQSLEVNEPSNKQLNNQQVIISNSEPLAPATSETNIENFEEFIKDYLQDNDNYTAEEIPVTKKVIEEEEVNPIATPKKESLEEELAANYTYRQIANSKEVEPAAQQWARQVEVPVYEIADKQAQKERYKGENKDIASAATEMFKKYGTIEQDGSRIYRSDAFVIRQEGDKISIHRRSDELQGWKNSLMEFKPGKGNNNSKITKQPKEMLGVERQEFLMVGEYFQEKGSLPDLSNSDIRDVANSLGSLAPAGTIKTLKTFKENEMLDTLNNILVQAGKDELTVGEFTIKRTPDPEGKKASLQLFKTSEERGTQELVRFNLSKTEDGIKKEVAKMNISDYDINQIKFISHNTNKLNLEHIFEGGQSPTPQSQSQQIQSAGDIPVQLHPYIAEEWREMTKRGGPAWGGAINQGNEEILQKLKDNDGKLPIADQREMYLKIMTHKTNEAQRTGESTIEFTSLKDIMQDLQQWRTEEIKQQFTPTEIIGSNQKEKVASSPAPKTKSQGLEI